VIEVMLEAVFEDFKERIESGTEIMSVQSELLVVESDRNQQLVFGLVGVACAFLMFASIFAMVS